MGSYRVDTSRWPIVVHSVEGDLDDAQIDAYSQEGAAVFLRREPHVVVVDVRRMAYPSAYARARNTAWQRQYRNELRELCLGTVYVIASPTLRFITMTMLLMGQLPTPYRVCETLEEGLLWANERLAARRG